VTVNLVSANRTLTALRQAGSRRAQLLGGAGILAGMGAGLASYAYFREPLRVSLDKLTIRLPNAQRHLPAAGLRILHLTDTHFRGLHWREKAKIDAIRCACANLDYDLLVHTGDFLHDDGGLGNVLDLLDALPAPRLGAFAVFGNHDYTTYSANQLLNRSWAAFCALENGNRPRGKAAPWQEAARLVRFGRFLANMPFDLKRTGQNDVARLEDELVARNFQILHNRAVRLTHKPGEGDGVDLFIAGVDDFTEGLPDLGKALAEVPPAAPTLLLSHNPDILSEPAVSRADLVLSGHTHGGQIVLPWYGPAHTHTEHLARHEASGYLRRGRTQVFISRGVGEGIPLRFGASPQIALLTLLPE
jgi:hypothetical protein